MRKINSLVDPITYWAEIVEPDFASLKANPGNLRTAYHAAASLTHMADWIWHTHEAYVRNAFEITSHRQNEADFVKKLCDMNEDYSRVVGTANSFKHMKRRSLAKATYEPSTSEDVISIYEVTEIGHGSIREHPICAGPICGGEIIHTHEVYLEGNPPMKFTEVINRAVTFWLQLKQLHSW